MRSARSVSTLRVSGSGGQGSHGSPVQPCNGDGSQGIGARTPSRPPGSTRRSGGISASVRASSSPWNMNGVPRRVRRRTAAARARTSDPP